MNLDGDFWFDAINNNGYRLYLLEYLSAGARDKYQVRLYYPSRGTLDPDIVTPKGESIIMHGVRQAEAASPNGDWLYSLYLNQGYGPFVHALMLDPSRSPSALICQKPAKDDEDKQLLWSLALSKDRRHALRRQRRARLWSTEMAVTDGVPQVRRTATLARPNRDAPARSVALAALFAAPVAAGQARC